MRSGRGNKKFIFRKLHFTIIEIVVAMLVLATLLTIIMQFFESARSGWSLASSKNRVFENARVAFGLMNRHIQGIYYKNEVVPFYHKGSDYTGSPDEFANDSLSFVAYMDDLPNTSCTSKACEVQYQLYYNASDDDVEDTAGWLLISVTGNKTAADAPNDMWNFYDYTAAALDVYESTGGDENTHVFTGDSGSRDNYMKFIPYVTELNFTCYGQDGDPLADGSQFCPSSIEIELSLLDKSSWDKWISLGAKGNKNREGNLSVEPSDAEAYRTKHEHTFKRTIYIGNRGQ